MLTLLTFPGSFGQPSHSPFCVKAMCLLQMSGQAWRPEYVNNPAPMPLGRLPVLRVEDRLIPDSAHIQAFLETRGAEFNAGLNSDACARSHALIAMTEYNLRMILVHARWSDDRCWPEVRRAFFSAIPAPINGFITRRLRKKVVTGLTAHGIGQFTEEERLTRAKQDITAIMTELGDQNFLFGQAPSAADAAIAPVLAMLCSLPAPVPLQRLAAEWPGLTEYLKRVEEAIYPRLG